MENKLVVTSEQAKKIIEATEIVLALTREINILTPIHPTGSAYICPSNGFNDIDLVMYMPKLNPDIHTNFKSFEDSDNLPHLLLKRIIKALPDTEVADNYGTMGKCEDNTPAYTCGRVKPSEDNVSFDGETYEFISCRPVKGLNVIILFDRMVYTRYVYATDIAMMAAISTKTERIRLFDIIMRSNTVGRFPKVMIERHEDIVNWVKSVLKLCTSGDSAI